MPVTAPKAMPAFIPFRAVSLLAEDACCCGTAVATGVTRDSWTERTGDSDDVVNNEVLVVVDVVDVDALNVGSVDKIEMLRGKEPENMTTSYQSLHYSR